MPGTCLDCGAILEGRADKKFCSAYCKTSYHYKRNKPKEKSMYVRIDRQLKINRKILKKYNRGGKTTVDCDKLIREGFDPNYFTHYWKNDKKDVYLFCYEFGFLKIHQNYKDKYVLVVWQHYMEKR